MADNPIQDLPRGSPRVLLGLREETTTVSGPLPPPEILERYDQIVPGLAERIVRMAEQEQEHAHHLQKEQLTQDSAAFKLQMSYFGRGQWFAFVLALTFVFIATWLALTGHEYVASVIGGSTILGIVSAYIIGYWRPKKKSPSQ